MNERMTELWRQSWVKIHPDDPIHERFDEAKFAELIVGECIDCAEWVGQVNKTPVEPISTAHAIKKRIKQRFGIEQ